MEDQSVTTKTVMNQAMPNATVQKEVVSTSNSTSSNTFVVSKLNQVIWFIIGLIELFIIARFVLLLLGARNTEFVSFIYSVGRVFILPFTGIFESPTFNGTSYFETAAVLGAIFWVIIGLIITYLISIFDKSEV